MENLTEQIEENITPNVEDVEDVEIVEEPQEKEDDVVEENTSTSSDDMDAKYGSAFVVQREFERALGKESTKHVQL